MDPFKDVYTVVAAGPGGKQDEVLIIVEGRFNREKLEAKAAEAVKDPKQGLKLVKVGDYKIYEKEAENGKDPVLRAILSNSILVFGPKKEMIVDALDKQAGKKKSELKKELADLLAKVDSKQSIAVVALPNGLGNPQAQDFADKIKNVTGGVTVSDKVKAPLSWPARTRRAPRPWPRRSKTASSQAKGLIALMANQPERPGPGDRRDRHHQDRRRRQQRQPQGPGQQGCHHQAGKGRPEKAQGKAEVN